ncbi:MAG: hypothetical protein M5U27_00730 [Gaiella sp.]|nr:hypothetical protein [Gaiella sp.]
MIDELPQVDHRVVVAMKSTVPVGTGEKVRHRLDARGLLHVGYVSNPEFTAEGTAIRDFMAPDRIVIGAFDEADGDAVEALHAGIDAPLVRADVASAEMIKLAANAALMTRISFINEIANVCEATGADVVKVAEGIGHDRRIGKSFLRAGVGFGGSCLAGEETALVRRGSTTSLVTLEALYEGTEPLADVEILTWRGDGDGTEFRPIEVLTRRHFNGDLLRVRTKMGRRVRCTPDHPFVVRDGSRVLAQDLTTADWIPLAQGAPYDVVRAGALRLPEAARLDLELGDATVGTAKNDTHVPVTIEATRAFWRVAGLAQGPTCCDQRVPDALWNEPPEHKLAFLSGLWQGDGSWSLVRGGPSVVLELGTASRELADGVQRLLGDLGVVASVEVGRVSKSTVDTFWVRISGAGQVEAMLELVEESDRPAVVDSIGRQAKRIAPTGFRRGDNAAWVRVVDVEREPFSGFVYSLEVPPTHTFVTTGGLVTSNCFPKDSLALKQLAANSGYHFQVLNAVIEVNELQKRRVIGKLTQLLGSLRGTRIALLGLAFKPNTDDTREAPAFVLAGRLLAEGADVVTWDPVAHADGLHGVEQVGSVEDAVRGADAVVLVTEWPELADVDWAALAATMRRCVFVDGRNMLDPEAMRAAGFTYDAIGRAAANGPR